MTKQKALAALVVVLGAYISLVWIMKMFGPGAKLMFSVVTGILVIYFVSVLLQKKK